MIKMLLSMTFAQSILAASTMAILDNQIDYTHNRLSDHIWTNSVELRNGIDDDNNGFVDDINGWNFIDDSNKLFDFSGYGSFPSDVYKYYEVRAKKTLGTITEKELEWYNKTRKDPEFKAIKKKFSKFSHGTHVACLAMDMSLMPTPLVEADIKFMPVKYLGEAKSGAFVRPEFKPLEKGSEKEKIKHIKKYIESYKVWMLGKLEVAISYASGNADVIHGSWGQGYGTTKKIVEGLFDDQFEKHEKFTDLKKTMTDSFIANLVDRGTDLLSEYKENLFVFSAGNKKEDTDVELHYPSSILLSNVISVAASDRDSEKAYFSNFGQSTVSIFAPGIAIESCVPENRKLPINGTSQAAPQVSSVALKLFALLNELDIKVNPSLVKTLILKTVDKTEQLTKFSASGGILNPKRAFSAAKRLKKMSLKEAIAQSYVDFPNP